MGANREKQGPIGANTGQQGPTTANRGETGFLGWVVKEIQRRKTGSNGIIQGLKRGQFEPNCVK